MLINKIIKNNLLFRTIKSTKPKIAATVFSVNGIEEILQNLGFVCENGDYVYRGNDVSDIGHAIQMHAGKNGFSVVRDLVGHGIGKNLHEEPQVPNYGPPKQGHEIKEGMCLAIEPMINLGNKEVKTDDDGWTIRTRDGTFSAHFEHTIAVTASGPLVLSKAKA